MSDSPLEMTVSRRQMLLAGATVSVAMLTTHADVINPDLLAFVKS